jgi:hypothetical protein
VAAVPPPRHPGPWFGQSPLARPPQGPKREEFVRGVPRTWQEALGLPPPDPPAGAPVAPEARPPEAPPGRRDGGG